MRLNWSFDARADLIGLAEYYREFDPALADDMMRRVEDAPLPLLDFPRLGPRTTAGSRKWRVPRTPFLLFYDVIDQEVRITAVRHARSNWKGSV